MGNCRNWPQNLSMVAKSCNNSRHMDNEHCKSDVWNKILQNYLRFDYQIKYYFY